jgi:hypothetical protein
MGAVCTYLFAPWYYIPRMMPDSTKTTSDKIRYGGRVVGGVLGAAGGCAAIAFAAPAIYTGAAHANASATEATTPDGTPLKDESVSTADKAGGGIAATIVSYFLLSHATAAGVGIGGVITDCVVGGVESCWEGGKSMCRGTANKCSRAASCIKEAFTCCRRQAPQQEVKMEKPQLPPDAQRV